MALTWVTHWQPTTGLRWVLHGSAMALRSTRLSWGISKPENNVHHPRLLLMHQVAVPHARVFSVFQVPIDIGQYFRWPFRSAVARQPFPSVPALSLERHSDGMLGYTIESSFPLYVATQNIKENFS